MTNKAIFVTGIGTDVGKTVVCAILVKALKADYWKPIQSGTDTDWDRLTVKDLVDDETLIFHKESFALSKPLSPHAAAKIDNVEISLDQIKIPDTKNRLIVEGAGGVLVPINEHQTVMDLIKFLDFPVIVVSKNYLGSINHTLLTLDYLKSKGINILGVIFNGPDTPETQNIIQKLSGCKILGRIDFVKNLDRNFIDNESKKFPKII